MGKRACKHWQNSLGDRFPCHLAKDQDYVNSATSGLVAGASNKRPWGY